MTIEIDPPDAPGPPAAPLSRALVLRTALDIIDRDGVAGLSMRRLGGALDRDPMSLYRYAANKAALLDGVDGGEPDTTYGVDDASMSTSPVALPEGRPGAASQPIANEAPTPDDP